MSASGGAGGKKKYEIGEHVRIRYNPENPEQIAAPADIKNMFIAGVIALVIGGFILIVKMIVN